MRNWLVIWLWICFVHLSMHTLQAQWRGLQVTDLGPGDGINSTITKMILDSNGILCLASNAGMYTYDSHSFDFYGYDPMDSTTIGQGDVQGMICTKDGMVWLTTRFDGLNAFDPLTKKFQRYGVPFMHFSSNPGAHGLLEDQDGTIWVGAGHFRLLAFDRKEQCFATYTPDWIDAKQHGGRLMPLAIVQDPEDENLLWLSILDYKPPGSPLNSYGIVSFDKCTKIFTSHPCNGYIRYVDDQKRFWGNYWGNHITRFDPESGACDTFMYQVMHNGHSLKPISHDVQIYNDEMYVSSTKALMTYSSANGYKVQILAGQEEEFQHLFVDQMNNLWLGSNHGIKVIEPKRQHIRYFSLAEMGVISRLFPARLAYVSSENAVYLSQTNNENYNGLFRVPAHDSNGIVTYIPTSEPVLGVATDHRERIWVASQGVFQLLDPSSRKLTATGVPAPGEPRLPYVFIMRSNPEGWVAATARNEFVWFHADRLQLHRINLDAFPGSASGESFNKAITGFTLNQRNIAYVFSNQVHQVNLSSGHMRELNYDPLVNRNAQPIRCVAEDKDGFIWMSTFTMTAKFSLQEDSLVLIDTYTRQNGMTSQVSEELHIDHRNRVWCFTPLGMNCIDQESGEIREFGYREGLPLPFLDPTQVLTLADGSVSTVCDNGLIIFDPDALWKSAGASRVRVILQTIRISGQNVIDQVSNGLRLPATNSGLDIEFQALAFPVDDKVEYSYRITGLQDLWISLGRNKLVTIPALRPGTYAFEVKSGNPQSDAPVTSLVIAVATPVYQQPWFLVTSGLLLICTLTLLFRWRIAHVRRLSEEKAGVARQIAELELKALRSQMNPHFMFNSLNSIKNYILDADPQTAAEYLSSFSHLIRMILQNSREKTITLEDELETLKLYVELERMRFENAFDFSCVVDAKLPMHQVQIPPMLLQPFVENAIWHGLMHKPKKDRGHLHLQFDMDGNTVACSIEDNGVGRAYAGKMKSLSATKYKSMGIGITRDRIDILNKMDALGISVEVTDKSDPQGNPAGTQVIVRMPFNFNAVF